MKKTTLYKLLGMALASGSLGGRGLICGGCPDAPMAPPRVVPIPVEVNAVASADTEADAGSDAGAVTVTGTDTPAGAGTDTGTDTRAETETSADEDAALAAIAAKHCPSLCPSEFCRATMVKDVNGKSQPALECESRVRDSGRCVGGRRPQGLEAPVFAEEDTSAGGAVSGATAGGWLAQVAFLEAASVDAFRTLRRDLRSLGAPRRLLRAASRAARDERRHARRMTSLARRYGGRVPSPRVDPTSPPSLEAMAIWNAVEGCVGETFGALTAAFQAGAAGDREVRAAMAKISLEEAEHAALAWSIHAWAERRLDKAARARVAEARSLALKDLFAAAEAQPAEALVRALGVPGRDAARALLHGLAEAVGATS